LTYQSRDDIRGIAGGKWNDDPDRLRRVGLPESGARHERQCGSAGREMQKTSAWQFHPVSLIYGLGVAPAS
jgi:hypothetical protein